MSQPPKQSSKGENSTLAYAAVGIGAAAALLGGLLYVRTRSSKTLTQRSKEQGNTETQNEKTDGTSDSIESMTQEEIKAQWAKYVQEAKELFKNQDCLGAAEKYSEALKLTPSIEGYSDKTTGLLNNRSAMYEKAGEHARCILDCNLCLMGDPEHKLARVRKARVYEAMGRMDDALTELCAHMIIEKKKVVQARKEGKPIPQFSVPQRLESVTAGTASKLASVIQAKRDGEPSRHFLPSAQAMYDILRSFESYSKLEDAYGTMRETTATDKLQAASNPVEKISARMDRAMVHILQRQYEDAEMDIAEAYAELKQAGDEEVGATKAADVLAWHGTFLYLKQSRDDAKEALERSCVLNGLNPEVWIKLAGVALDSEDTAEAKRLFDRALDLDDNYATTYLFHAQYHAVVGQLDKAFEDLQKCMDLNPRHISAYGRMVTMKIQSGDANGAKAIIDKSLKVAPKSSELNNTMGEYIYGMATVNNNLEDAKRSIDYFDKAITLDPKNPIAYVNKGLAVLNVLHNVEEALELLDKALEVDPNNLQALLHVGQLKCSLASTLEEAEKASKNFDVAIELTRDNNELQELCSLKVAIDARMNGARALGLTDFPT